MKSTEYKLLATMIGTALILIGLWRMEAVMIAKVNQARGEGYSVTNLLGLTSNLNFEWHLGILSVIIGWFLCLFWIVWKD